MGIQNFATFIVTTLFFIMTPGIDTVFVLNKSISKGRKAGVLATLGVNSGILVHTLFDAVGLSVMLAKSQVAFSIIKYGGAIYLIYIGFLSVKNKKQKLLDVVEISNKKKLQNDFYSGFITNTLNPKVALFFLAFFPQFIISTQLDNPIPFIILGVTYAIMGVFWYLCLTLFVSSFSNAIKNNPKAGLWLHGISGIIFILMGIKIGLLS